MGVSKENDNRGSIVRSGKNRLTAQGSKMKRETYWMLEGSFWRELRKFSRPEETGFELKC